MDADARWLLCRLFGHRWRKQIAGGMGFIEMKTYDWCWLGRHLRDGR